MPQTETKLTVFTIDDSEIVYNNMGSFLAEIKHVKWIGHAFNLSDAYLLLSKNLPDIVILDIQLKTESSFEFLDYLNKKYPNIVVVMFTNMSSTPYRKKCAELGAKFFLDKSAEFEQIPKILRELLQTK